MRLSFTKSNRYHYSNCASPSSINSLSSVVSPRPFPLQEESSNAESSTSKWSLMSHSIRRVRSYVSQGPETGPLRSLNHHQIRADRRERSGFKKVWSRIQGCFLGPSREGVCISPSTRARYHSSLAKRLHGALPAVDWAPYTYEDVEAAYMLYLDGRRSILSESILSRIFRAENRLASGSYQYLDRMPLFLSFRRRR